MTLLWRHALPSYLCLYCLSACFSVDPQVITRDDDEKDASLAREPDAEVEATLDEDAGVRDASDSSSDGGDAAIDSGPAFCDSDEDCTAQQFCSVQSYLCEARCSAEQGCVQPLWPFENTIDFSLIAADHHVYWGSSRTTDGAGNLRDDAKIWSWDLKTEPKVVATNVCGFPYFALDGQRIAIGSTPTGCRRSFARDT